MWTSGDRALVGNFGAGQALTDAQFRLLEPLIPPARHGARPRTTDTRNLLDGLFYLVRTGVPVAAPTAASSLPALAHGVRLPARLPPERRMRREPATTSSSCCAG